MSGLTTASRIIIVCSEEGRKVPLVGKPFIVRIGSQSVTQSSLKRDSLATTSMKMDTVALVSFDISHSISSTTDFFVRNIRLLNIE